MMNSASGPSFGSSPASAPTPGSVVPPGAEPPMQSPFVNNAAPEAPAIPGLAVGGATERKLSIHTILLLIVMLVSAGALYGMRKIGGGGATASAAANPLQVDMTTVPKPDTRHLQVIAELNKNRVENQVPTDGLQKNPFVLTLRPVVRDRVNTGTVTTTEPRDAAAIQADALTRDLTKRLEEIELNSVMAGSNPLARINGRMYKVGDTLLNEFTITAINGREVHLEAQGQRFILSMTSN